jgi:hypothetical protein
MPRAREHVSHISVELDIIFKEIYEALESNGFPASAANVVKLCGILEAAARAAASDALVDWRERPTNLEVL